MAKTMQASLQRPPVLVFAVALLQALPVPCPGVIRENVLIPNTCHRRAKNRRKSGGISSLGAAAHSAASAELLCETGVCLKGCALFSRPNVRFVYKAHQLHRSKAIEFSTRLAEE
jgi:hypothetical protein